MAYPHECGARFRDSDLSHKLAGLPEFGQLPRLGMDVVVNAVWLAYYRAKTEGVAKAASALEDVQGSGPGKDN